VHATVEFGDGFAILAAEKAGQMRLRIISRVFQGAVLIVGYVGVSLSAPAADGPKRIEVAAKRFAYTPSEITLKKGEPVVLVLRSDDVAHGIKFKELGLDTEMHRGAIAELAFTPMQTGDFVGRCSRFCGAGHGSMTLTLHVTE
jgi:cytochrome c oxidase subunit 2